MVPPALYDPISLRPTRSCLNCTHLNRVTMGNCTAYPAGLPYDIVSGETRHDRPIPGDRGIQWEAAPDAPTGLPEGWALADALRLEATLAT
jgi:hypothetical protein